MKKRIKSPWFWLALALVLCFISMIGTSFMQTNWGKSDLDVFVGTLSDVAEMIRENNEATGKDIEVTFTEDSNSTYSFMTIIPENATADNPVPAIICSHGGANTKEMQMPTYVELARRGFVVISIDASGHGYTDNIDELTQGSLGMLPAAEYAMSLPCVDETQIGVTGHSMGNQACFYTIAALNVEGSDQRIAAWVEGAGSNYAPQMTEENIQGLVWTISVDKYDEFDTVYFSSYNILETDLGKSLVQKYYPEFDEAVIPEGQWYSFDGPIDDPAEGEAVSVDSAFRMVNPPITHPMYHFTKTGTAITIEGFYSAFGTPSGAETIGVDDQVWQFCVVFEVLGLIGFFMMMFPLVVLPQPDGAESAEETGKQKDEDRGFPQPAFFHRYMGHWLLLLDNQQDDCAGRDNHSRTEATPEEHLIAAHTGRLFGSRNGRGNRGDRAFRADRIGCNVFTRHCGSFFRTDREGNRGKAGEGDRDGAVAIVNDERRVNQFPLAAGIVVQAEDFIVGGNAEVKADLDRVAGVEQFSGSIVDADVEQVADNQVSGSEHRPGRFEHAVDIRNQIRDRRGLLDLGIGSGQRRRNFRVRRAGVGHRRYRETVSGEPLDFGSVGIADNGNRFLAAFGRDRYGFRGCFAGDTGREIGCHCGSGSHAGRCHQRCQNCR